MSSTVTTTGPRPLELLAPARNTAIAREAILHGADAVYIGAPSHGARAKAGNSIDDIRQLVEFATPFGVKVYVTVNTIIYDDELADVERMLWQLYAAGVDALIVQDMSLLEMRRPPIQLHASTQCDTRDPEKARWLQECGMSQIVIARETDIDTIRRIHDAVDVPLEAFVHGALCVSYSGDCRASQVLTGRSANRGNCAQMCRLPYTLVDGDGRIIGKKHYLSLRDMNRLAYLGEMADAGVSSFKIEGRLKDAAYVKEVTLAYRQALDRLIEANPGRYCRASRGRITATFAPELSKSFNRGYTDYFLHGSVTGSARKAAIASLDSPKALGEYVGKVVRTAGPAIDTAPTATLVNGDGLSYITPDGNTGGFRANRVIDNRIFPAEKINLPAGTRLYRSFDKEREEILARPSSTRVIDINLTIERHGSDTIALTGSIDGIGEVTVTAGHQSEKAQNDPTAHRRRQLSKWGDTIFTVAGYDDRVADEFIPASLLSDLRRRLASALTATLAARRTIASAASATERKLPPEGAHLTHRGNVSNRLAEKFYKECGVTSIEPAIEIRRPKCSKEPLTLMETRYCLRRELGACLRGGGNEKLRGPLTLRGQGFEMQLAFDCDKCRMKVNYAGK